MRRLHCIAFPCFHACRLPLLSTRHPPQDEMVPPSQMHELHKAHKAKDCQVLEIPAAHHMDAYDVDPTTYWSTLAGFVDKYA